jgi:ATP phosphoribosyltransferase regulatory subunit
MTPQIARMVATRLSREPAPIRLCYEGTIVRRRQGRARRHRQVPQAGIELYGVASVDGDLEVLRLAASVARAVGLVEAGSQANPRPRFLIDVGHASIARALLDATPSAHAAAVMQALAAKDRGALEAELSRAASAGIAPEIARALTALPDLHGGGDDDPRAAKVFDRARAELAGTPAIQPLDELAALWGAACALPELASVLRVDLGEVRGFAYYTGMIFHALAEGPGEPIAAGGRYDDLLARFDVPMPAVGFALHLDAVAWAREAAGASDAEASRVVVVGANAPAIAEALRLHGVAAVSHEDDVVAFARAWRYSHILAAKSGDAVLSSTSGAELVRWPASEDVGALALAVVAAIGG